MSDGGEARARPALIVAIAALAWFGALAGPRLVNPDEGRYTEVAREMAAGGDWLVPRLNGAPHWAKPPLTYWLTAGSLRLFGATEWAARLPSANSIRSEIELPPRFILSDLTCPVPMRARRRSLAMPKKVSRSCVCGVIGALAIRNPSAGHVGGARLAAATRSVARSPSAAGPAAA